MDEEKVIENKVEVTEKNKSDNSVKFQKKGTLKKWINRIFVCILLLVGLIIGAYEFVIHSTQYETMLDKAYDKLATMDKETFRKLKNTTIHDNEGNVIGEINAGSYVYAEISNIPITLQNAYIAAEDQNFKHHRGVDYKGTLRAALVLIKNKGEIKQGGSTITQQVIKNNLLSQEQSFSRKFMEIMMAPDLEKKYSKQEIMEFYCNSNYYGNGCYGVENASRFYFGKPVKELTLAESAMIAGISNSPNNYNPVTSIELATKKKNSILNKMFDQGMITEKDKKLAKKQEIIVTKTARETVNSNNYMSSYAIHCATEELMKLDGFEFQYLFDSEDTYKNYQKKYKETYNEKSSLIRGGGYQIHTSFDMNIQKKLQESVDEKLGGHKEQQENGKYALQGAAVCIDNASNYIVAMVGGRGEHDQFNRGFLANRQPGSAIKPLLVYGPAFDKGIISPATIYTDKKVSYNGYSPKNANRKYLGNMNIRKALSLSTNTVAMQVFHDVGQEQAMKYLKKMEFSAMRYADNSAISIALGGFTNGVKVDEMAKAYSAIQHNGQYTDKNCITKIEHEKNGLVYNSEKAKSKEIYHADAAYMLTDTMQSVFNEEIGTGHYINLNGQIAAGKTGTTNSKRDAWLCGFTNYYTTAVWVGRDDNKVLSDTKYAGRIWEDFMKKMHKDKKASDFSVPDTVEYRNVKGNGHLGTSVYDKSKLDMSKSSYYRRPDGYDLASGILAERLLAFETEKETKQKLENAQNAVTKFEAYEITDIKTAKGLEKIYGETISAIEDMNNTEIQSQLKTRVAEKYEKLSNTYKKWESKIEESEEQEKQLAKEEQANRDDKNLNSATEKLKKQRLSNMNRFLELMSKRMFNTSTARQLINDAQNCLENCREYAEYSGLKSQFDNEVNRINALPTEVPKPEIPENNNDTPPDSGNYPLEEIPEYTP